MELVKLKPAAAHTHYRRLLAANLDKSTLTEKEFDAVERAICTTLGGNWQNAGVNATVSGKSVRWKRSNIRRIFFVMGGTM